MVRICIGIFAFLYSMGVRGEVVERDVPKLNPNDFNLRSETVTPSERQELYLKLLEDFIGWAEKDYWVDSSELEKGGGYYNASGSGVTWGRGNSNMCLALGVLLTGKPSLRSFTKYDILRSTLEDHLEKTLRSLCLSNKNYSGHTADRWGEPSWQASLEFNGAAWVAHLQERILSQSTLDMVKEVLAGVEPSWAMLTDEVSARQKRIRWYYGLAERFHPENYDPDKWMAAAAKAGFAYAVLTAKHCDGYTLWASKHARYRSSHDLIAPYVRACRKHGLKVGFYFSPRDWSVHDFPMFGNKYRNTYEIYINGREPLDWTPQEAQARFDKFNEFTRSVSEYSPSKCVSLYY